MGDRGGARVLVCGAEGQVGRALTAAAWPAGVVVVGMGRAALDVTDPGHVAAAVGQGWSLVVNCAADTNVDGAERDPLRAFAVNRDGAALVARACAAAATPLVHLSTDFVFDGALTRPYREDDAPRPVNAYGASKAAGEAAVRAAWRQHVILRLSWVYSAHGRNFATTIAARATGELAVVDDQVGAPTAAADVAAAVVAVATRAMADGPAVWGTYHVAAQGWVSRHGFAQAILDALAGRGAGVGLLRAIHSAALTATARRPANSRLDCARFDATFGALRRPWRDAVPQVVDAILAQAAAQETAA